MFYLNVLSHINDCIMCWLVDDEGPSSELCKGQGCLNSNTGLLLLYCKLTSAKQMCKTNEQGRDILNQSVVIAFCFPKCWWVPVDTCHALKGDALGWGEILSDPPGSCQCHQTLTGYTGLPMGLCLFFGVCETGEVSAGSGESDSQNASRICH